MWYIYTTKYSSAIKGNNVLPPATIWMNFEYIILMKTDSKGHILYDFIYIKMFFFFFVIVIVLNTYSNELGERILSSKYTRPQISFIHPCSLSVLFSNILK